MGLAVYRAGESSRGVGPVAAALLASVAANTPEGGSP
jgi:hypothetical protein